MEQQMTVREASDALRVSTKTIRKWIARGMLKARKIGRGWLIPASAVEGRVA